MCITIQALIRVRYSRNDPICLPTFGIVAGKTRMPVAQYAPGCTPPPRGLINLPGSSLEYPRYSQEYLTTSPLHRPAEVVLMVPDGSLDASERTAE